VQQGVSFLATFLRLKKVRFIKELGVNLFQLHEIGNVDRMRRFDAHLLEVFVL
jgi:hypothetical protein